MKTFEQLTKEQKAKAVEGETNSLLEAICSGAIRFNDRLNKDKLQARIDTALKKAESMGTPWFASEYIMDTCKDDIIGMAQCSAEDALYAEEHEHVIHGIE